jgi:hypothetical protein
MNRPHLRYADVPAVEWIDALDPALAAFHLALNRMNCHCYDGTPTLTGRPEALGMPLWTLMDCCFLPSAVVGFLAPRAALDDDLARMVDPEASLKDVAISEFIAVPTMVPGRVTGISLFSAWSGRALGRRSKALGLLCLDAKEQIGITQFSNPSILLHLAFGALHVVAPRVDVHSRPGETFVYRIDVPPRSVLHRLIDGDLRHAWDRGEALARAEWVQVLPNGSFPESAGLEVGSRVVDARVREGKVSEIAILPPA